MVEKDAPETHAGIATNCVFDKPTVRPCTELGVQTDEIVLHGGFLEDLMDQELCVQCAAEAATNQLGKEWLEFFHGQLVQDAVLS